MSLYHCTVTDFADWRAQARNLVAQEIPPENIVWQDAGDKAAPLFTTTPIPTCDTIIAVPPEFPVFAETVSLHNDPVKWPLLYACLWRLARGEKNLLRISSDPLVRKLNLMFKAVRRDAHKAKAFIRFRVYHDENNQPDYVAWHQPDHNILPLVAPFFQRRFSVMRWTVMTPFCSASWDGETLAFHDGVAQYDHPHDDAMEEVWQSYYRATFNPARIKLKMMRTEMPVRYWRTLPETALIPAMLQEAEERVETMLQQAAAMATHDQKAANGIVSPAQE